MLFRKISTVSYEKQKTCQVPTVDKVQRFERVKQVVHTVTTVL